MKLCICFEICMSSNQFCLRLIFSSFSQACADNGWTNQYSCQLFYGQGWHTLCYSISKTHIVVEIPSTLRCFSYLISRFLTDIKHLAKNWQMGILSAPFWCLCQISLFYALIKFCYTKSSKWSRLVSGPGLKSSPLEVESQQSTQLEAATFQFDPSPGLHIPTAHWISKSEFTMGITNVMKYKLNPLSPS